MAVEGVRVLIFASDAILLRHRLAGEAHVAILESVPEAVLDHGIQQLGVAHAKTVAPLR